MQHLGVSAVKYFGRLQPASANRSRAVNAAAISAFVLFIALPGQSATARAQDTSSTSTTSGSIGTGALTSSTTPRRPARKPFRAARLTYIEGDVRVEQANSTANSTAVVNMPLVEGTVISSGAEGQAEIEFEDGSLARLTPNSGLSLVNLTVDSSGNYQSRISLLGGLIYLELRAGTRYLYSVDAGGDVISPVENATIRVSFDEPPASVAVLDGSAHFVTAGAKSFIDAAAGQTVQTDPSSDGNVLLVKSAIAPETWDQWNEDRDQEAANEASNQTDARDKFAGNQGYGWSDLDANGNWYDVPGHGQVWQPDLAASPDDQAPGDDQTSAEDSGFDPYGYGSWAWTPTGYAWASGYGWGWLPYRCGLWNYYNGFGWGWSPNTDCGIYGFAGYGYGGYGFNFGVLPPRYRRPVRPIPGPGPIHPILRGHGGPVPVSPVHRVTGDRVIAGVTAHPLQPVANGFADRGGGVLGAGLRRDYPVNATTHAPETGIFAATPGNPVAASYARRVRQPVGQAGGPARGTYSPQRPAPGQLYEEGNRPAPVNRSAPAPVERQAPSAPRYSPPPASHSAPAASSSSPKGK